MTRPSTFSIEIKEGGMLVFLAHGIAGPQVNNLMAAFLKARQSPVAELVTRVDRERIVQAR